MASALLNGMINAKAITADRLWISDQSKAQLAKYQTEALKGIHTSTDNSEVAKHCDILILAVKPHIVPIVLKEIAAVMEPGKHLLISIAAGVPLLTIEALLPAGTKAVRVMPNTPSLVGAGAAGIALGSNAHADTDGALVEFMFQCVGEAVVVAENLLDAVTGVSGSGEEHTQTRMHTGSAIGRALFVLLITVASSIIITDTDFLCCYFSCCCCFHRPCLHLRADRSAC